MWVVDHVDDLDSDLSRFHRIDDLHAMPAVRFLNLSERIFAYRGVVWMRAQNEDRESAASARDPELSLDELMFEQPGLFEVAHAG